MKHTAAYRDSVAVVTGGGSGLGAALASRLDALGARVWVLDVDAAAAERVAAALLRPKAALACDVGDESALEAAIDRVLAAEGRLDLMVNNAGVDVTGEALDIPTETWARILQVNLMGAIHGCRLAYRVMIDQGHGRILNIASGAGLIGFPMGAPYTASKSGLIGFSLALRAEAKRNNVIVSVACPGLVRTPLYGAGPAAAGVDRAAFLASLPGGVMDPERCAETVLKAAAGGPARIVVPRSLAFGHWLASAVPWVGEGIRDNLARIYDRVARR